MVYAQTNYVPSENISVDSLFYSGYQYQTISDLPGEVTSSTYASYNAFSPSANISQQELLQYVRYTPIDAQSIPKRRSSNSYPYPASHHDATRSPTRSRFHIPASIAATSPPYEVRSSYDSSPSPPTPTHSPTRGRQHSAVQGAGRHSHPYGRNSRDGVIENISRVARGQPSHPLGPSNHVLVPQGIFHEPASSQSFHYRHPPITFQVKDFPEIGIRVGSAVMFDSPVLVGNDDLVLESIKERELKIQIIWPGYAGVLFEKRLKTLGGVQTRGIVALKLAHMVLDFASHIQHLRATIEPSHRQWKISDRRSSSGIKTSDIFITKLVHCGGSHWQMELWVPRE